MTTGDLVSVIIPIYNAEPYLDQALHSVREQTHGDLEVICLNDGSTDGSLAIVERHASEDGRLVVVDKQNQGYGATCNRGLAEAHGEWVAILEPDDWLEPRMFEDLLAFAASLGQPVDVLKSAYWRILDPDTPRQRKVNCSYRRRVRPGRQPFAIAEAAHLLSHHPSIWSALYRKAFLDERGIRFREFPGAGWADNPFLIETLCQTDRIAYLDEAYYCYREETAQKAADFARRNPLLPFERWNDMADELERLSIDDEGIWRAHNSRGFTYLSGVIEEVGIDQPEVRAAATAMFERMDADLVFADPEVSPGCKRMFAELRGLPCPPISSASYLRSLVAEGLYSLRNAGPAYTARFLLRFLRSYGRRTGAA